MQKENCSLKIILIGDSGVGKTSIAYRYVKGELNDGESTIGVDFFVKEVDVDSETINVRIWDTAGQERYFSLVSSIFNEANGIIIVFDLSSEESFNDVQKWMKMINDKARTNLSMILVGNKHDLDDRQISFEQAHNYAVESNISYIETSALNGYNIDEAFSQIISLSYDNMKKDITENVNLAEQDENKPCFC